MGGSVCAICPGRALSSARVERISSRIVSGGDGAEKRLTRVANECEVMMDGKRRGGAGRERQGGCVVDWAARRRLRGAAGERVSLSC